MLTLLLRHVMIVDDDIEIRLLVAKFLEQNGYRVTGVRDGREMRELMANTEVDLVVLDLMLPGETGLALCKELRTRPGCQIPIVMLTARGDETDRIVGLEIGADDYLTKPFNPRELLARINVVLRRSNPTDGIAAQSPRRWSRFAGWTLDLRRQELTSPSGAIVDLSGSEFDLLVAFLEHPHRVLNRDQLLELTRNRVAYGPDRSIDVQISRLRRKLDRSQTPEPIIKTIRGSGYLFAPEVEHE